jgi:hypothetical protein
MSVVTSKNRPLYVLPSESMAFMVPETESALRQLKLTGVASVIVALNPVPAVQTPMRPSNNRNAGFSIEMLTPRLPF